MSEQIAPGDWCTWLHTPRGGYGAVWPVDALVKEVRGSRAKVQVTLREGARVDRWVKLESLRRWIEQPCGKETPCP